MNKVTQVTKVAKRRKVEKKLLSDEKPITVCVDAMGGDFGPEPVLEGIFRALHIKSNLKVLIAGDEDIIEPLCAEYENALPLPCGQTIDMDEHPAEAVRTKRDSSIVKGCKAVKEGKADAFFSAGSTGAVLTAATLNVGRTKGVKRPALGVVLPGRDKHKTVFLDLGANADLRPELYPQLASMGVSFYHTVVEDKVCKVGLLSNGSEDSKGSEHSLEAFQALSAAAKKAPYSFAGNAEGNDLLLGNYDVIVASGFLGNVALKSMEGAVKYVVNFLKAGLGAAPLRALGLLLIKGRLKKIGFDLSGEAYGGAVLLGLKNPVLIGHGKTSAKAVCNGILSAAEMVEKGLCDSVEKELNEMEPPVEGPKPIRMPVVEEKPAEEKTEAEAQKD